MRRCLRANAAYAELTCQRHDLKANGARCLASWLALPFVSSTASDAIEAAATGAVHNAPLTTAYCGTTAVPEPDDFRASPTHSDTAVSQVKLRNDVFTHRNRQHGQVDATRACMCKLHTAHEPRQFAQSAHRGYNLAPPVDCAVSPLHTRPTQARAPTRQAAAAEAPACRRRAGALRVSWLKGGRMRGCRAIVDSGRRKCLRSVMHAAAAAALCDRCMRGSRPPSRPVRAAGCSSTAVLVSCRARFGACGAALLPRPQLRQPLQVRAPWPEGASASSRCNPQPADWRPGQAMLAPHWDS